MKALLKQLLCLIFFLSFTPSFAGDTIDQKLQEKLKHAGPTETFRVLIMMREQLDVQTYDRDLIRHLDFRENHLSNMTELYFHHIGVLHRWQTIFHLKKRQKRPME